MSLKQALKPDFVLISDDSVKDKNEVLETIARLAKKSPLLSKYREKDIYKALNEREQAGSTGFGKGIAIPHCRLDKLEGFVIGAVIFPNGVDFDSLDKEPTHIAFFIIGPSGERNRHIQALSEISQILQNKQAFAQLLSVQSPEEFFKAFNGFVKDTAEEGLPNEKSLMQICIQRESAFNDILEELSAFTKGSISVLETKNASNYLNTMPLFSTYWTESEYHFNRIILAVVDRKFANEITRRISLIVEDIHEKPGVLILVSPLSIVVGSLEY